MQDKITLEELAPYLPYSIRVTDGKSTPLKLTVNNYNTQIDNLQKKPLVRPLSQLTQEIEHNGERFVPIVELLKSYCFNVDIMTQEEIQSYSKSIIEIDMSYNTAQKLFSWHFDLNNWIERGLALPIEL